MDKKIDENMSDEESNLNLDKDDEDLEFETFNPKIKLSSKKEEKSMSDKSKKSVDLSEFTNPIFSLFRKRSRSFESSNSSNSIAKKENKKKHKELTGLQKAFIESQKENFEKNYKILKEDIKLLEEYEKEIFKDTNLDIMFIMDLTGSMGVWLEEAKNNIKSIIEEIIDNNPGSKIRVSFIGYRDYLEINEERKYNSKEFTEDINEIYDFISKLSCWGGGDVPEDVVGALKEALNMKWESNSKYAILVCDAPCHGKKYHSVSYDRFSDGDPTGVTLEEMMKKFYEKGITFYCLEIDYTTETMFKIMKEVYNDDNKFHIEKLNNTSQFSFFVAFSASVLLGNSKYNKYKFNDVISNFRKETIEKIMKKYVNKNINISNNNNDLNTMDLINHIEGLQLGGEDKKLFDFINRMNDLNINNSNNNNSINNNNDFINIKIDKNSMNEFNEIEINYNLRALSYNKNLNIVNDWVNPIIQEREYKTKLIISYNLLEINNNQYEFNIYDQKLDKQKRGKIPFFIEKKYYNNPKLYINNLSYNELICEQIGDYFNILLEEKLPYSKQFIKFQKHVLYEINKENNNIINDNYYLNNKYIISEETVPIQLDISLPMEKRTLQSFSHFSYQISGGQLLITNFKYDKNTKKVIDFKIYFLKDNEYKNILEFFASHICDNTCKTLELVHPRKKNSPITISEKFYSNKYLTDIKLCECCSAPISIKDKNRSLNCKFCSCKEITTKYKAVCSECQQPFFYSTYVYNCKLINFPNRCPKCNSDF